MSKPIKLLIVDDEPDIQNLIKRYFSKMGYSVFCAGTGQAMQRQMRMHSIDIVLLDVCLPDSNGFDLLSEIKANSQTAVIMLTVQAATEQRVAGLNQGADDYLPKPFDLSELAARITAVLRRQNPSHPTDKLAAPAPQLFRFEGYQLNTGLRQVSDREGREVKLTPAEYELLLVLVNNAEKVLDRDFLSRTTRGRPVSAYDRSIDVRLSQLRKKLAVEGRDKPLFTTIRGGGYMLDCEVEVSEAT